jgi:hypothetical protein
MLSFKFEMKKSVANIRSSEQWLKYIVVILIKENIATSDKVKKNRLSTDVVTCTKDWCRTWSNEVLFVHVFLTCS